jgi:CRISPR/Cas system-associated protein Cas7 (RAMP superfamily)
MDWTNLAEDRERRRELVNAIMNLKGSIIFGEILDQLRTSQLLRKDSVSWS